MFDSCARSGASVIGILLSFLWLCSTGLSVCYVYVIALTDSCARSGLSVCNYINVVFLYDSYVRAGVCLCVMCR